MPNIKYTNIYSRTKLFIILYIRPQQQGGMVLGDLAAVEKNRWGNGDCTKHFNDWSKFGFCLLIIALLYCFFIIVADFIPFAPVLMNGKHSNL
jgi:hypothetical protein